MGFSILARNGLCSLMICWLLLVPAGVPVLVSLLFSFFPQERGLFHHDLLVPLGSGWGSGACLPSLFFLSSGKGFCSIMICWFLLVPAGVPVLVSFFSFLSFLRKGVLFHHDLLVPLGSGWGSGACLPSSLFFLSSGKGFCSIMICWFLLVPAGVPVLVSLLLFSFFPQEKGFCSIMICWVPPGSGWGPVLVSLLFSFFPQERGSVPSWFAGSSWFRLGFRCLSPFFSFLSFLRKGVLFHHDLLVPLGSGWVPVLGLPSSLFFLSSGRGSVPSWFAGSSWFRLGFRCLSPFFSFLSFLRKGVLFHHDLLVPLGSGWGSGACLPSSLFFLSSGKGFCSIMICWFLLVPAGVPVLVSLLLFSFFPQERGSVPSWFAGSSWFRLGFRFLSPFFSLLSFPQEKWFCSIMICWFLLVPAGVPVLVSLLILLSYFFPQESGSVPSWFAGSSWFWLGFLGFVSLLLSSFFPQERGAVPSDLLVPPGSGWGSGACLPSSLFFLQDRGSVPSWFAGFLLVPAGVPGACLLSSLFFGSGACLPSSLFFLSSGKGVCSIMMCCFLQVPAGVPVLVSLLLSSLVPLLVSLLLSSFFPQERGSVPSWFVRSSWFRLGFGCLSPFFSLLWFRCLSPFFSLLSFLRKGVLFHHGFPGSSSFWRGFGACLPSSLWFFPQEKGMFHHGFLVPPASGWGSGACLPSSPFFFSQEKGFCSIMDFWFILLPAGVPVLVSLLLSSFFSQERDSVPSWIPGSSCFGLGFRCLSPFFSLLSFLNRSVPESSMNFELRMTLVETCVVAVWGLCWCIFFRVLCRVSFGCHLGCHLKFL